MKMKEKKKEEDKGKLDDMATKDTIKKDDEKKEEKPDTRGMYAKIAMIKNKLRSAGQRDPMVMAVDACEERTPAKDDPSFSQEYKDNVKKSIKSLRDTANEKLMKTGKKMMKKAPSPIKTKRPKPKPPIKTGKPKYNPYMKAPKGKMQATPENMAPGKP